MFVDPATRSVVANQTGAEGGLREEDGVFTGTLPKEIVVSSTRVIWLGTAWSQILWPLPEDADERRVLLMHESFHRLQPALGFDHFQEAANAHLGVLEGRYLLRLEWLALARALQAADDDAACRSAITDALVFRSRRHALFPGAQAQETALEENEGVAEYTGVRLGCPDGADQQARYTRGELARVAQNISYVRSFAYATGPAYGLLLDRYDPRPDPATGGATLPLPTWRVDFRSTPDFARLLAVRTNVALPADLAAAVAARTADPKSQRIRAEEETRETHRQQVLAADRQRFVDGPVLRIALRRMNVQFNPSNLRPLDTLGTVYPNLRLTDHWGVLEVSDGALLRSDWKQITVAAPASIPPPGTEISGPGWTLELKAGWEMAADSREGDYHLTAH